MPALKTNKEMPPAARASHELRFGDAWEYAPAPETTKVDIAPRYGHFINGRFTSPRKTFATLNPATEEHLADVGQGGASEVDAAVRAAAAAQPKWASLRAAERAKYLFRIARRIDGNTCEDDRGLAGAAADEDVGHGASRVVHTAAANAQDGRRRCRVDVGGIQA